MPTRWRRRTFVSGSPRAEASVTTAASERPSEARQTAGCGNKGQRAGTVQTCHIIQVHLSLRSIFRCWRQSLSPGVALRLQRAPDFVNAAHCIRISFVGSVLVATTVDLTHETEFVSIGVAANEIAAPKTTTTNRQIRFTSFSSSSLSRHQ